MSNHTPCRRSGSTWSIETVPPISAFMRPMTPASWAWAWARRAEMLRWPLGSHLDEVSRSASQPRTAPAGRETARARSVAVLTSCSIRARVARLFRVVMLTPNLPDP